MRTALLVLFAASLVAGCGTEESRRPSEQTSDTFQEAPAGSPTMMDGVQVVEIEAGGQGFMPTAVHLQAGVPARLIFKRTTDATCLQHVSVPEFGIEKKPLPPHEEVAVEFIPDAGGRFTFVCGMGMQTGTLVISA